MEDTTHKKIDIHKAGGILIKDRRFLAERSRDAGGLYLTPGGRVEAGETVKQALVRELMEEFRIKVAEADLEEFGTFYAQAAGQEHLSIRMDVFLVKSWKGVPTPDNEVEEIAWVTSKLEPGMTIGSIFEHEVIPRLKARDLID